jgi:hypothetical protein
MEMIWNEAIGKQVGKRRDKSVQASHKVIVISIISE